MAKIVTFMSSYASNVIVCVTPKYVHGHMDTVRTKFRTVKAKRKYLMVENTFQVSFFMQFTDW